ncbi:MULTISPECIES: hypothetical protein [unclassified Cryobacterium]|uniref:hypothetical protein n=1 Tax=unclassified Cryobacterium TaxID=2649013 RepID=UPI001304968C|nr:MULTISPECIES: hypothetical protein [unclassified Cryobacterium]
MNQPHVTTDDVTQDLPARLAAIEDRPLEERAAAYVQEHDGLRGHLEGGDVPRASHS